MATGWDAARQRLFLEHLAETSNVTSACRKARIDKTAAYARKREDAEFRAAWLDALATGYEELEMEMLRRARFGVRKTLAKKGEAVSSVTEYSDAQGLRLLTAHKQEVLAVKSLQPHAGGQSAKQRLAETLRALHARQQELDREEGES